MDATLNLEPLHASIYTRRSRAGVAPGTTLVALSLCEEIAAEDESIVVLEFHHN